MMRIGEIKNIWLRRAVLIAAFPGAVILFALVALVEAFTDFATTVAKELRRREGTLLTIAIDCWRR